MNLSKNAFCRQPFKELNTLPVPSQYILSTLLFLTKNKDQFMTCSQMHKITTWQIFYLDIPTANLTIHQKVVYYQGIKIYNHLPKSIKHLSGDKNKFKLTIKRYLLHKFTYLLHNCTYLSHNCTYLLHNCTYLLHNCTYMLHNRTHLSRNCTYLLHNCCCSLKEYFDTQLVLLSHSISLLFRLILILVLTITSKTTQ